MARHTGALRYESQCRTLQGRERPFDSRQGGRARRGGSAGSQDEKNAKKDKSRSHNRTQ